MRADTHVFHVPSESAALRNDWRALAVARILCFHVRIYVCARVHLRPCAVFLIFIPITSPCHQSHHCPLLRLSQMPASSFGSSGQRHWPFSSSDHSFLPRSFTGTMMAASRSARGAVSHLWQQDRSGLPNARHVWPFFPSRFPSSRGQNLANRSDVRRPARRQSIGPRGCASIPRSPGAKIQRRR